MKHLSILMCALLFTAKSFPGFDKVPLSNFSNLESTKALATEDYAIVMTKDSLSKNYLLTSAIIEGAPMPFGNANKTKIIYFVRRANTLYMFENLTGQVVSDSIPTKRLLAEFKILSEDSYSLTFDFKEGMNRLLAMSEMYGSDFSGDVTETPIEISTSFLNKVSVDRLGVLFIDQLVNAKAGNGGSEIPLQVKYTLREYHPSSDFKGKESSYINKVGFFEVNPTFEDGTGRKRVNIMRFDSNKPVLYGISADVPKEYRDAVRDGILYWNKAFGKEVLHVYDLDSTTLPHDHGHNIVKWVNYDDAGFAYADINADPLTGEILQTHVYMTSVFAVSGKNRARQLLIKMANHKESSKKHQITLKGFNKNHICQHEFKNKFAGEITSILSNKNLSEEAIHRFSADYVRSVVAHEVGHTLGLRHNFAGSMSSTIEPSEYDNLLKDYFKTGNIPADKITTTTVMDYTNTVDSVFQGAAIRLGQEVYSYDKAAIQWGYSNKSLDDVDFPLFCTDSLSGKYADCLVWDRTNNVLKGKVADLNDAKKDLAHRLAIKFFAAKTAKDERDRLKLSEVALSPKSDARRISSLYLDMLSSLNADTQFVSVLNEFPYVTDFNRDEYVTETNEVKSSSLEALGGLKSVIFNTIYKKEGDKFTLIPFALNLEDSFQEILTSDVFLNGGDLTRDEFIFSAKEIIFMSDISKKYFEKLRKELVLSLLVSLAKAQNLEVDGELLEEILKELANEVILKKSTKTISGKVNGEQKTVNTYKYSNEVRTKVASILTSKIYSRWHDFSLDLKTELKSELGKTLSAVVGSGNARVSTSKVSRSLRKWVLEMDKLISKL